MSSATAVLGFSKCDRDVLGGWSAEGSERYSRAAKHTITSMQKAVSQSFTSSDLDLLGEAYDIDALGIFLKSWDVPDKEILRAENLLVDRTFTDVDDTPEASSGQVELAPGELAPDDDLDEALPMRNKASKEKQEVWNRGRSDLLGATTSSPESFFEPNLNPDITYPIRRRKQSKCCTGWANATCSQGGLHALCLRWLRFSRCGFVRYGLQVVRQVEGFPVGSEFFLHQHLIFE